MSAVSRANAAAARLANAATRYFPREAARMLATHFGPLSPAQSKTRSSAGTRSAPSSCPIAASLDVGSAPPGRSMTPTGFSNQPGGVAAAGFPAHFTVTLMVPSPCAFAKNQFMPPDTFNPNSRLTSSGTSRARNDPATSS
jgi:hypothetical protein